jgi:maleate isomerase
MEKQIAAAKLLCDAGVDSLVWGGTSASWLGAEHDAKFCGLLESATGIPSGSCTLEMNRLFSAHNAKTFGLVTPYTSDVQKRIIKNYRSSVWLLRNNAFALVKILNNNKYMLK